MYMYIYIYMHICTRRRRTNIAPRCTTPPSSATPPPESAALLLPWSVLDELTPATVRHCMVLHRVFARDFCKRVRSFLMAGADASFSFGGRPFWRARKTRARPSDSEGAVSVPCFRGSHLSNTTCLTQVFFRRGK